MEMESLSAISGMRSGPTQGAQKSPPAKAEVGLLHSEVPRASAWVFRTNVTGDFGIVTEDFGLS